MSDITITFVGTGAIGTSMGLALKQARDDLILVAHDKDPKNTRQAMKMGAFDRSEWNLINACEPADLIVLAMPGAGIRPTLEAIAPYLKPDAIVTDTSQTKADIVRMATDILPEHVHFVGGNPIVTCEPGPENATAEMFQKSLYCLTPSPKVIPEAVKLLEDFVNLIGATPFYLDPVEHDGLMAGINMLPTLLGLSLIKSVTEPAAWVEMRKLAGGLFAQVSSGANGDPDSLAEAMVHDKDNILRWLDAAATALQEFRSLVAAGEHEPLAQAIDKAVVERRNWYQDFESKRLSDLYEAPTNTKLEDPGLMGRMFGFGGLFGGGRRRDKPGRDKGR